ncbi:MAG TPA: hypothetical protein VF625_02465 [Longimicrobium sp.]|jgi:DNA uptake protein ComE-like DNA-binding protein
MKRSILPVLVCAALAACGDSGEGAAENAAETAPAAAPAAPAGPAATTPAPAAAPAPADGAMLDPNSATRDQLLAVPGMNAQLADALVAGRPYADMRAVDKVLAPALGEEQRDQVYARVWKPIDLNTASKEEILLIPGVGARMQHEFEEYRPYRAMEQFRREIGKYVDAGEVARLERYVTIAPAQ